jgi:excisionase family DNA binding protein
VPTDKLLTADEVADWLQLTPAWVQAMARTGEIPALRLGRFWRFDRDSVAAWLRDRQGAVHHRRTE